MRGYDNIFYTLIVMAYERAKPLRFCLESISKLDYEKKLFEVLVIDDGSREDIFSVVSLFQNKLDIKYIKQKHGGVSKARNTGIKNARGEVIGFIADDYLLRPGYLKKVERFYQKNPRTQVISFNTLSCGDGVSKYVQQVYTELVIWSRIKDPYNTELIESYELPASRGAFFKREVFEQVGFFNENLIGGEDTEFSIRLTKSNIPVHCYPHYYIEHWEDKSFSSFLDQRYRYGKNCFDALYSLNKNKIAKDGKKIKHSFFDQWHIIESGGKSLYIFWKVARRIGKVKSFFIFAPFLYLFLIFYFKGFYSNGSAKAKPLMKNSFLSLTRQRWAPL
jgi:glycosyltransferase involved in cell wall biosynthesis